MARESESGRRMRLSPEREDEVYDTVLRLLGEMGYDRLTMPAVAEAARCSTATIYRQWQGKLRLVIAALARVDPPVEPGGEIDTGSLRNDLLEMCRRIEAAPAANTVIAALAHAAIKEPELAAALRDHFSIHKSAEILLRNAAERGDLPAHSPVIEFLPTLPLALLVAHLMLEGRPADASYLERFVDVVLLPAFEVHATRA